MEYLKLFYSLVLFAGIIDQTPLLLYPSVSVCYFFVWFVFFSSPSLFESLCFSRANRPMFYLIRAVHIFTEKIVLFLDCSKAASDDETKTEMVQPNQTTRNGNGNAVCSERLPKRLNLAIHSYCITSVYFRTYYRNVFQPIIPKISERFCRKTPEKLIFFKHL